MSRHREWLSNDLCSVAGTLEILGERWTILVLREAFLGTHRFDDFLRHTNDPHEWADVAPPRGRSQNNWFGDWLSGQ